MSDRRAAIRRERNEFRKIAKHKSPMGDMERAVAQGTLDGRVLAVCIICVILKEHYSFGTKRLKRLIDLSNAEAGKFEQMATQFNMQFYQEKMVERIRKVNLKFSVPNAKEKAYAMQKNAVFISSCSIMFIVLNQEFGFSSNSKGTGRTDWIMEYALNEFIRFNLNKEHSVNWYIKRLEEKTGVKLVD